MLFNSFLDFSSAFRASTSAQIELMSLQTHDLYFLSFGRCLDVRTSASDSADMYRERSDLALFLDKDDFVLGGYAVDSAKYPLKPRPTGRGKARVVEEEEDKEEEEGEEEEVEVEVDEPVNKPLGTQEDVDLDAGGSDHMHVDMIIDAGNHILNFASMELCLLHFEVDVLTPSHVLAGEAGPSNSQRSTGAPDDVVDISDEASSSHSSSDDDDSPENVVTSPPRKRHRQSQVHP